MIRHLLLLSLAVTSAAQDKVQIDNAWVRVLRVNLAPHEKIALRQHPATVTVALKNVHEKMTGADVAIHGVDAWAGHAGFTEAGKYTEENVTDHTLEAVIIELKPGAPKSPSITLDPVKLDPEHHEVLLENDRVRVIRTSLFPHVKSPMHEHPHYVVVYMTELHTTMKLGDGRVVDNPRHPGDIAWRDALKHQTEQMGDQVAVEIQVEIK